MSDRDDTDPRPAPDTKARILEAAFQRLAREGYGALSIREIGKDAGVNHALVNYHFHSKEQLVIAVLDDLNRRLLARQQALYDGPGSPADKWAQARRFYENDLASGFVRVLMELYAASMSNAALREAFRPRMNAWFDLIERAVVAAVEDYRLQLPVSPQVISTWICNFWMGTELAMLAGTGRAGAHQEALAAVEKLLRGLGAPPRTASFRPAAGRKQRNAGLPR